MTVVIPAQDGRRGRPGRGRPIGADGCIVLVDEASHADVRFALNTTTTNGVRRDRRHRHRHRHGGRRGASSACPGAAAPSTWSEMVAAALTDAQAAPPAEDAFALSTMGAARGGAAAARGLTGGARRDRPVGAGRRAVRPLGAFGRAAGTGTPSWPAFAEYGVSTLYLGQLDRRAAVARPADRVRSTWSGAHADGAAVGLDRCRGGSNGAARLRRDGGRALAPPRTGPARADRPRRRPLRGHPPAVGRGRPDGLARPSTRSAAKTPRTAGPSSRPQTAAAPGSASSSPRALHALQRPRSSRASSACRSSPWARRLGGSVFDNGLPFGAHRLDP